MFYKFFRKVAWLLVHCLYRIKTEGFENVPKDGGFLMCGNHVSAMDPIVLASFTKPNMFFMAKKELFKNKLLGWFLGKVNAFPIDRTGTDMDAFRKSLAVLNGGNGLLIFSQGTRMKDFEGSKAGVAMFALKSGVPIVPVGIGGEYGFRKKIIIKVGAPISMEPYKGMKVKTELVDEVMEKVVESVTALL